MWQAWRCWTTRGCVGLDANECMKESGGRRRSRRNWVSCKIIRLHAWIWNLYLLMHGYGLMGCMHAIVVSSLLDQISLMQDSISCCNCSSGRSTRFLWRVDEDVHLGTKIEKKNYVTRKVKAGRRSLTLCGHVSCFASSSIKQKGVYGSRLHQGNRVVREPRACDG